MTDVHGIEVDAEEALEALGIEFDVEKGSYGWINVLCPLHEESRPSFGLNYYHGGWVDRHTGETGNLVSLVEQVKDIGRDEAVQWLQGMKLPQAVVTERLRRALERATELEDTAEDGGDLEEWWTRYQQLDPVVMAKYFFDRGFTPMTMHRFEVRYDDEQRGIIWPVRSREGELIGMVMRRVGEGEPKYLYNEGFQRRKTFFPLNFYDSSEVVLVEGPLDSMWLHQCGVQGALCTFGAMAQEQVELLKGLVCKVVVAFDNNEAGKEMTDRIVPKLANILHVRLARHPEGVNDPQELSPEQVVEMIAGAESLLQNLLLRLT